MSRNGADPNILVEKALVFCLKCPNATILECILTAGFSQKEINDMNKCTLIHRHLKKISGTNKDYVTPPTQMVNLGLVDGSRLSSVTCPFLTLLSLEKRTNHQFLMGMTSLSKAD